MAAKLSDFPNHYEAICPSEGDGSRVCVNAMSASGQNSDLSFPAKAGA